MYKIEELVDKFVEHARTAEKNQKDLLAQFKVNNPGKPLPEHLQDDFNLPLALASMCSLLLHLKNKK